MTASRIIRGTRAKILLYVCGIFIITAIIACYNNTLSQLDDVRRANELCHQQEENLSTQLQVISDYKVRIEKSLKAEKAEHQQTKITLENKLNDERSKNEKNFGDVKIKFSSLQQHFNILQTEYDDYKEECSKTQQKQQEEINDLQSKLEEVKEELKKVKASKESLKTEYIELQTQKDNVEKQLKQSSRNKNENESQILHLTKENEDMRKELDELKEKCSVNDVLPEPKVVAEISSPKSRSSPSSDLNNVGDKQNVLPQPSSSQASVSSSKSTTKAGFQPSAGALANAKPLLIPTVTPESLKVNPDVKKLPKGVVAFSEKKNNDRAVPVLEDKKGGMKNTILGLNEPEIPNNRYQNVKDNADDLVDDHKDAGKEDVDKENGAEEVFDAPQAHPFDNLGFQAGPMLHKDGAKKSPHILGIEVEESKKKNQENDQQDYRELQMENEEDDDAEGYEDHLARQKDPAVRN